MTFPCRDSTPRLQSCNVVNIQVDRRFRGPPKIWKIKEITGSLV